MTEAGFLKELILISGFAFGWVLMGHEEYAKQMGWPVIVRLEDAGYVKLLAALTMVGAVISSLFVTPWWFVFITLVGGFAFGFILSKIFKSTVQPISIIGLIACYIAAPLYLWK